MNMSVIEHVGLKSCDLTIPTLLNTSAPREKLEKSKYFSTLPKKRDDTTSASPTAQRPATSSMFTLGTSPFNPSTSSHHNVQQSYQFRFKLHLSPSSYAFLERFPASTSVLWRWIHSSWKFYKPLVTVMSRSMQELCYLYDSTVTFCYAHYCLAMC